MNTDPADRCFRRAVVLELLGDTITPVQAFHTLTRDVPTAFLFESSEHDSKLARFSIIGVDPLELIRIKNLHATIVRRESDEVISALITNAFDFLCERHQANVQTLLQEDIPDFLPFSCGLAGYLGYGIARPDFSSERTQRDPLDVPDVLMGFFDSTVIFDHLLRRVFIITFRSAQYARQLKAQLEEPGRLRSLPFPDVRSFSPQDCFDGVSSATSPTEFLTAVNQCKQYIAEGQAFQIVLSQRFHTPVARDSLDIYRMLQSINPSPYAYYLKFPELCYLGSSPETLVQCKDNRVSLRALAGTRRRGRTAEQDKAIEQELKSDEKEMAEHLMLVDLGRNDLGRIAEPGTVATGEIATVVRYSHVMHLSTEIHAQLTDGTTSFDVLRSCFPAGTVSGAPKIRAMQLLASLEQEQRGVYAGMVGYININGDTDGAIAIRSALIKDGKAHVTAGAGIVYDSVPESEYEETRTKATSVLHAIKLAHATEVPGSCQ